ncbi:hypothetical protein O3G_MSEX006134 [Manduca sexta]|nr:hypothetical protein O3G_MSEX006134 [Manduca sexta]
MTNLLSHATGILQDKAATAVVWSGAGVAIPKAISCAEILKKQFSIEYQVTKLSYKKVEEYWEPKVDGLETLVVKRQIPLIHILLSTEAIPDCNQIGYQTLSGKKFWQKEQTQDRKQQQSYKSKKQKRKKNE